MNQNNNYNNFNQNFNFEELAKKPTGAFEVKKYLYQAGLANIYEDYQQNIANLKKEELRQVQDAYIVREMSKKYLGEYASDVGIGDVSGKLLDIYGDYQKARQDIGLSFGEQRFNLEKEYRANKFSIFAEQLANQYDLEVAKLNFAEEEIMTNLAVGETGGMTPLEYVEANRNKLSESTYMTLYSQIKNEETTKELMTPKSYRDPSSDIYDITYDARYTFGKDVLPMLDETSEVYQIGGKEYAQVSKNVNDDKWANNPVDSFTLSQYYEDTFESSPNAGDIMQYMGNYYVLKSSPKGVEWFRLISSNTSKTTFDSAFLKKDEQGNIIPNVEVQKEWSKDNERGINYKPSKKSGEDKFEYGNNVYMQLYQMGHFKPSTTKDDELEIIQKFREVHQDKKDVVIYWKGKFWVYNDKGYTAMARIK